MATETKTTKTTEEYSLYGFVQPRYGRYGISGWDVIIKALNECLFFPTKSQALKWMKNHGYGAIVG